MPKTKKTRGSKKKKEMLTAKNTDRHALYQSAVQEPEADTRFMEETFVDNFGRRPVLLREDFCGTGFLSATWVKEKSDRRAVGYDLDEPTVHWGMKHNISPLTDEEKEQARAWLRRLRCRTGREGMLQIAEGIRQRGARAELVRIAKELECDACDAHAQRRAVDREEGVAPGRRGIR